MRTTTNFKIIFIVLIISILYIIGCAEKDEDICPKSKISTLNMSFEIAEGQDLDSLLIFSPSINKYFFRDKILPNFFSLPLNINSDTTQISIEIKLKSENKKSVETLLFIHSKQIESKNLECGFLVNFHLKNIISTTHLIDSIIILDRVVNFDKRKNVKIYF